MHVAVFIGERVIWAIIAVLMPFILLVMDMQAGGPMQYLLSSRMISRQLAELFQSPLGLPIVGVYFSGMILLGPPIWNRIRTRGRGKLAEVKAQSRMAMQSLQDAHLPTEAGGIALKKRTIPPGDTTPTR